MIKEVHGDLLTCGADILCHQVNYHGVMGGGVAYAIATKLFTPDDYKAYQTLCLQQREQLVGSVQYIQSSIDPRYTIANLFSQDERLAVMGSVSITDYSAMERGLLRLEQYAYTAKKSVAVPGYIGCGIAGGDWTRVKDILRRVFGEDFDVSITIVYKD